MKKLLTYSLLLSLISQSVIAIPVWAETPHRSPAGRDLISSSALNAVGAWFPHGWDSIIPPLVFGMVPDTGTGLPLFSVPVRPKSFTPIYQSHATSVNGTDSTGETSSGATMETQADAHDEEVEDEIPVPPVTFGFREFSPEEETIAAEVIRDAKPFILEKHSRIVETYVDELQAWLPIPVVAYIAHYLAAAEARFSVMDVFSLVRIMMDPRFSDEAVRHVSRARDVPAVTKPLRQINFRYNASPIRGHLGSLVSLEWMGKNASDQGREFHDVVMGAMLRPIDVEASNEPFPSGTDHSEFSWAGRLNGSLLQPDMPFILESKMLFLKRDVEPQKVAHQLVKKINHKLNALSLARAAPERYSVFDHGKALPELSNGLLRSSKVRFIYQVNYRQEPGVDPQLFYKALQDQMADLTRTYPWLDLEIALEPIKDKLYDLYGESMSSQLWHRPFVHSADHLLTFSERCQVDGLIDVLRSHAELIEHGRPTNAPDVWESLFVEEMHEALRSGEVDLRQVRLLRKIIFLRVGQRPVEQLRTAEGTPDALVFRGRMAQAFALFRELKIGYGVPELAKALRSVPSDSRIPLVDLTRALRAMTPIRPSKLTPDIDPAVAERHGMATALFVADLMAWVPPDSYSEFKRLLGLSVPLNPLQSQGLLEVLMDPRMKAWHDLIEKYLGVTGIENTFEEIAKDDSPIVRNGFLGELVGIDTLLRNPPADLHHLRLLRLSSPVKRPNGTDRTELDAVLLAEDSIGKTRVIVYEGKERYLKPNSSAANIERWTDVTMPGLARDRQVVIESFWNDPNYAVPYEMDRFYTHETSRQGSRIVAHPWQKDGHPVHFDSLRVPVSDIILIFGTRHTMETPERQAEVEQALRASIDQFAIAPFETRLHMYQRPVVYEAKPRDLTQENLNRITEYFQVINGYRALLDEHTVGNALTALGKEIEIVTRRMVFRPDEAAFITQYLQRTVDPEGAEPLKTFARFMRLVLDHGIVPLLDTADLDMYRAATSPFEAFKFRLAHLKKIPHFFSGLTTMFELSSLLAVGGVILATGLKVVFPRVSDWIVSHSNLSMLLLSVPSIWFAFFAGRPASRAVAMAA